MNYDFPVIRTIDDVLPHIKDRPEFVVAEREFFTVINYNVIMADTFPPVTDLTSAIRRECRGIVFDVNKNILSRRLHKFFNLGEREETQLHSLNLNNYRYQEKRDGSMITPLIPFAQFTIHWATKMGLTDVGQKAADYVRKTDGIFSYEAFAIYCFQEYLTPIFEYTSPDNRIVVKYDKEALVLLHIRENFSGRYLTPEEIEAILYHFNIPYVHEFNGDVSLDHMNGRLANMSGIEGYVVVYDNGHMLKMKTSEYVAIHKAKDHILLPKNRIRMILEETVDDVMPHLDKDDADELRDLTDKVNSGIIRLAKEFVEYVHSNRFLSIQEFAEINKRIAPHEAAIAFKLFRSDCTIDAAVGYIKDYMLKQTSTATKLAEIEYIWSD